jgi:hypothetical protein
MTEQSIVTPQAGQDATFFWEGVLRHELLIQKCSSCGKLRHPPRPMCPYCRSIHWETARSSGRGIVATFVVHHYPPIRGFDPPHVVAVVELQEGTRIVSNVIGIDPAKVEIGLPVAVSFEVLYDNVLLPVFRPEA